MIPAARSANFCVTPANAGVQIGGRAWAPAFAGELQLLNGGRA